MEIYSMLNYNTIFFAECQDGNRFLFHFVNFVQTQAIFYSILTSKNIPFFIICAVVFHRDHCGESCAPSRNSSPSQKTVKNCCPIYKKAAEDIFPKWEDSSAVFVYRVCCGRRLLLSSAKNSSTFFCAFINCCISFRTLR